MTYPAAAWERAMKVQEVMLKAISGEIHWFQAADILGMHPRSLRRWRQRYERHGYDGLLDRRRRRPSIQRVPTVEVERVLRLYRERYQGFNVRHFHEVARRDHGVTLSYSYVKQALQTAGLVKKRRPRGRHFRRREPRACFGELLHLDGSLHRWLALAPELRPTLLTIPYDATNRVLHAAFYPRESTQAVMTGLWAVFETYGLPMALYTDRAKWAFHTPRAKGPVDKTRLTQVGRALARLGIEHIPAYSPQARGRSERLFRTLQDRLVNELRVAKITTLEAANAYLADTFLPHYNATFARAPRDPARAFVPLGDADLDTILCQEEERVVTQDNVVMLQRQPLQVAPQPGRQDLCGPAGPCAAASRWPLHHQLWTALAGHLRQHGPAGRLGARGPSAPTGRRQSVAAAALGRDNEEADRSHVKHDRTNHLLTTAGARNGAGGRANGEPGQRGRI